MLDTEKMLETKHICEYACDINCQNMKDMFLPRSYQISIRDVLIKIFILLVIMLII